MFPVEKRLINACLLACIESFLKDNGHCIDQERIVNILPREICSMDGIVWKSREACESLGIVYEIIPTQFPIPEPREKETILITTERPPTGIEDGSGRHCVRFHSNQPGNKILVMDPDIIMNKDHLRYMDKNEFDNRVCTLHKLSLVIPNQD